MLFLGIGSAVGVKQQPQQKTSAGAAEWCGESMPPVRILVCGAGLQGEHYHAFLASLNQFFGKGVRVILSYPAW